MPETRPDLSVVIASVNGLPYPMDCLDALAAQREHLNLEVIVADSTSQATVTAIAERHPWVRVIHFETQQTVPALRSAGVDAATSDLVAITEDHCVPRADWTEKLIAGQRRTGWAAVGGGVEHYATGRPIDWAAYFCEYANLIAPVQSGPTNGVPGMNVVYDLKQLAPLRPIFSQGLWENVIHDRIRAGGYEIGLDSEVVVEHRKHFSIAMFLSERYHYSRAYAGNRVDGEPLQVRLINACRALALPPVLIYRIVSAVLKRRRHMGRLARSAPLIVFFAEVWSIGEVVGYLRGPGDSMLRIK